MSTAARAIDPSTGQPFKAPSATERFVGWMWSKYSRKVLLKIGVVTAPIIGMVSAHFGNTPSAQEAIGIGLSALVLGLLDFVVSYVGKRLGYTNLESLQKLSEEQEPIRPQPAISFTSDSGQYFTRSEMFKEITAKPTSPSEENAALLELRESLLKPAIALPTDGEIFETELKRNGFAVESWDKNDGVPTVTYYETKLLAIVFRDEQRANHVRANLL